MKKIQGVTLLVIALLALTGTALWAAPLAEEGGLEFKSVTLAPGVPYPGQSVVATVAYRGNDVTEAISVLYRVEVVGVDTIVGGEGSFKLDAGVSEGEATFKFYAPVEEKTYSIKIFLDEQEFEQPLVVESALPETVSQLFAGLGIFVAVMAIMAVATEVVIESFKFVIGLKSKVTAMEALEQLKAELPGQLTGLGVAPELQKDVDKLLAGVEVTLRPVGVMPDAVEAVRSGSFSEAYAALKKLQTEANTLAKLEELKKPVVDAIEAGFKLLLERLPIGKDIVAPIEKSILDMIHDAQLEDVANLLDNVFKQLQSMITGNGPVLTSQWLHTQIDTYLTQGRAGVNDALESAVGALKDLGFPENEMQKIKGELVKQLDSVERVARDKNSIYAVSVKNLLAAVEERRNEMQSPARKIWRRLRDSQKPMLPALLCIIPVTILIVGSVIALFFSKPGFAFGTGWIWGAAICILVFLVGMIWLILAKSKGTGVNGQPAAGSLGHSLRYGPERWFNLLRGETRLPQDYGKIDENAAEQIKHVGPTTVAQILLQREDKHRDDETSRIRIMRVMTIGVGVVLAYWLRVDAAEYLDYAVPGIAARINSVNLGGLLGLPKDFTVGILLTGFAASAGSKFWRDLLGRLQTVKGQAEEAAQLVLKVKNMTNQE